MTENWTTHECTGCDFTTKYSAKMTMHVKSIHLKIKDFLCDKCDYAGVNSKNLKRHVFVNHEGNGKRRGRPKGSLDKGERKPRLKLEVEVSKS